MNIVQGNLWDAKDDILLVTTNATVKKNGELVMGRGAALEMKQRFPFLPAIFGRHILEYSHSGGKYGAILGDLWRNNQGTKEYLPQIVGAFQVKYNWWESANPELIEFSTNSLISLLNYEPLQDKTVCMNFPGIGNGKLSISDVLPIVAILPDRVTLYTKGNLNGSN